MEHTKISRVLGGIKERKILYPGKELPQYQKENEGEQISFHFKTEYQNDKGEWITIDDSRKLKTPMEIILGHKFKMEIWEELLKTMAIEEVSQFTLDKKLVQEYPFISSCYRKFAKYPIPCKVPTTSGGCCGKLLQTGIGYDDLDELLANPRDLRFTFELLQVQKKKDWRKYNFSLSTEEMKDKLGELKTEGNAFYEAGDFDNAEKSYQMALSFINNLTIKEIHNSDEYKELNRLNIPFLLNLAQLNLKKKNYYNVIENCDKVLEIDPNNVKAIYRRARANSFVWNKEEAMKDYERAKELDKSLTDVVTKEMKNLNLKYKEIEKKEKVELKKKMFF